ncbi:MAG: TolB family protein [Phycisphaeraceae bacterium]|nr:TolB family protein [Phycisphaeraceae bacterium]
MRANWIKGIAIAGCLLSTAGCGVFNTSLTTSWDWGGTKAEHDQRKAELAEREAQHHERWLAAGQWKPHPQSPTVDRPDAPGPATAQSPTVRFTDHRIAAHQRPEATAIGPVHPVHAVGDEQPLATTSRPVDIFGAVQGAGPGAAASTSGGETIRQVTFTTEGSDFDPDIDPSGQWVAFASTRHHENANIYLQRIGGTTVRQLTHSRGNDAMPRFSPDGRSVAFSSDRSGSWNLWLTTLDGGHARQLTHGPTQDIHPSFSPDGRRIVYSSWGARSGQWELWVIDVDNPANRQHIGYGLFPKWSPVDNRIVFQKPRQRGREWFSIWVIELEEGEARRPTELVAGDNAAAITPTWSPDGQHLVFTTVVNPPEHRGNPTSADIWVMDVDGRRRVNLTQNQFANLQPVWASDGTIYFVSNRGEGTEETIWSIRPRDAMRLVEAPWSSPTERTATVAPDDED